MKYPLIIFFLFYCVSLLSPILAAIFWARPSNKATFLKCWEPKLGYIKIFKTEQAGDFCGTITCHIDGWIEYQSCGVTELIEGCQWDKRNVDFPYPKCCPRSRCNDDPIYD